MARNKAEDFTEAVKRELRDRVANYCSNPDCGILTVSAKKSSKKGISNIGEAAHICSVQPNGARYNSSMSSAERKSTENGIWLCSACHHIIDTDPDSYSIELLNEWKTQAELNAIKSLKNRPKTDKDINEAQQNILAVLPLNSINNAISNVHKSVQQSLEKLDPRFNIISSYVNGQESYFFQPKDKNAKFKLSFELDYNDSTNLEFDQLFKHGKSISFKNIKSFNTDSPLFKHIFNLEGCLPNEIYIAPNKRVESHIIFSTDDESFVGENILKLDGNISFGSETFSFLGSIKNIVNFSFDKIPLNPNLQTDKYTAFLTFNFERWENEKLFSIVGIDEVYNFFRLIRNNELQTSLYI